MKYTLETLLKSGNKPRIHDNGFLQFELDDNNTTRLHIWFEGAQKSKVFTPIHDHVFEIRSTIICGTLHHKTYRITDSPNGSYKLYEAAKRIGDKKHDSILTQISGRYDLEKTGDYFLAKGTEYFFGAFEFHETEASEFTATIMRKERVYQNNPRIAVPADIDLDDDFSRYGFDDILLWDQIKILFSLVPEIIIE